jgi:hypothetical protein
MHFLTIYSYVGIVGNEEELEELEAVSRGFSA